MLKAKSVRGKTGASPKRGLAQYFVNNWDLYAMLLLPIVYIVIFKYVPMAGVQMVFRDYSVFKGMWDSPWVGLEHFKTFFSSSEFGKLLTNTASGFADVRSGDYFARAVSWAVSRGITSGTSAGRFSPHQACTRAQVVTFLYQDMARLNASYLKE